MNLNWWLERTFWEHPDKLAVIDADGTSVTYTELRALASKIGSVLREHAGVGEDDVVVTVMPDSHLHVAAFYATMRVGGIFSGMNPTARLSKLTADITRTAAKVVIVSPEHAHIGEVLADEPSVAAVYVTSGSHPRFPSLADLCRDADDELRIVQRARDDIAAINFTAGTSGASKGVIFPHGKLETSAWASIFLGGVRSDSRNLSLVGMFHSGGINDSIRLVMAGGTILWSQGWDVDRVVRIIHEHEPNWMYYIVPTMVRDLMRHPSWPELDLQGLKTHVAGEPVPPDVEAALTGKGAQIGNMYGLTESMPVCVLGPSLYYGDEGDAPKGSSGRPNKEFCSVALKDPFTGEELRGGDVEGELCISGDVVTPGYFNDEERTAEAFDSEGYLHTRDRAYRDDDGWYHIRGRTDDIISSGAEKLSLLEIDEVLLKHPSVRDAGCVGVPHERFGEVPAAFVVLSEPMSEDAARDLLDDYCLQELERWKRPRLYVLVGEVPRTAAKRTKLQGEMRAQIKGISLRDQDGVTTVGLLQG